MHLAIQLIITKNMNVGERSKKYVQFHMDHTFFPIFKKQVMINGLWHEASGGIRYEALVQEEDGSQSSYLFPIFNPESDEFDDYENDS